MADLRILLTDKTIARLPTPKDGWHLARDTELKGFFVVVGKRKRTFTVQGDLRQDGKRASSIRVAIGGTDEVSTRNARATAKEYLALISRGQHPKDETGSARASQTEATGNKTAAQLGGVTLKEAWQRYLDAHLVRKGRSEITIEGYRDHVERIFVDWLDTPLHELASDPARVATRHDEITNENGPYMANGCMRTLRAVYNHARKTNKSRPSDNPADAIDWNEEKRRDTGMGTSDLKGWFLKLAAIENPVRREFHLFTLLSGCRSAALQEIQLGHIDFRRRIVHIPRPKGGVKRAFDIPLSREMILCLIRAIRFGRQSQDRHRYRTDQRGQVHGQAKRPAIPRLEDVPSQSCRRHRRDGYVRRTDNLISSALRLIDCGAWSTANFMVWRHSASDRRMDRKSDHGSLRLGTSSPLSHS